MTGRTVDEVLAIMRADLIYRPETGEFIRARTTSSNAVMGSRAGFLNAKGYRQISVGGRAYRANRLAWLWMTGEWPAAQVDHVNGDRDDDRWANLRVATNQQNCANAKRRTDNKSGFKGVRKCRNRWQARMGGGGSIYIGTFDTPKEAHEAYAAAARQHYGHFARTE